MEVLEALDRKKLEAYEREVRTAAEVLQLEIRQPGITGCNADGCQYELSRAEAWRNYYVDHAAYSAAKRRIWKRGMSRPWAEPAWDRLPPEPEFPVDPPQAGPLPWSTAREE